MPVSRRYRGISGDAPTATYSFTDISDGTGIQIFNGFVTGGPNTGSFRASLSYALSTASPYSDISETSASINSSGPTSGAFTLQLSPFNLPKMMLGTAHVYMCWKVQATAGTTLNYPFAKLIHYDGITGTETVFAQASGAIVDSGTTPKVSALKISIPTVEEFKAGDSLRLMVGAEPITGAGELMIGMDPVNRDGGFITPSTNSKITTTLKFYAPFVLDV